MNDLLNSKFGLNDRVAIVTGSGQGIGKAIALHLAKAGAHVVVAEFNQATGEATAREVRALGRRSLAVAVDVTNSEQLSKLVKAVMTEFGRIDILVNNVGGNTLMTPVVKMSVEEWERVVKRNLTSVFMCSKAISPVMIGQKKGNIINISSAAGIRAYPGYSPYAAAKAGIINFTRTLAAELAPYYIRVNCIVPGSVETEAATSRRGTGRERAERAGIPLGRVAQPEDVALTAIYLASDASDYLTGETIEVKGGPYTRKGDMELFVEKFPEL